METSEMDSLNACTSIDGSDNSSAAPDSHITEMDLALIDKYINSTLYPKHIIIETIRLHKIGLSNTTIRARLMPTLPSLVTLRDRNRFGSSIYMWIRQFNFQIRRQAQNGDRELSPVRVTQSAFEAQVLARYHDNPGMSQARVAREFGMSKFTVADYVARAKHRKRKRQEQIPIYDSLALPSEFDKKCEPERERVTEPDEPEPKRYSQKNSISTETHNSDQSSAIVKIEPKTEIDDFESDYGVGRMHDNEDSQFESNVDELGVKSEFDAPQTVSDVSLNQMASVSIVPDQERDNEFAEYFIGAVAHDSTQTLQVKALILQLRANDDASLEGVDSKSDRILEAKHNFVKLLEAGVKQKVIEQLLHISKTQRTKWLEAHKRRRLLGSRQRKK